MFDRSELQVFAIIVGLLIALVAGYLWYVNRQKQTYASRFIVKAGVADVWRACEVRPGRIAGVPNLRSCRWVDESGSDMSIIYSNGLELRQRVVEFEVERYSRAEARIRPEPDAPWGDLMTTSMWFDAVDDGRTAMRVVIEIEREHGGASTGIRPFYPWMAGAVRRFVKTRLAAGAAGEEAVAEPASEGPTGASTEKNAVRPAGGRFLWQLVLVLATLAWLAWLLGPWAGLGGLAMLVCHEYGHVWSMRRHGHATARFYLIPFFGGIAIGQKEYGSEAESVEISLMGPVFGLAAPVASYALWAATGDPFFAALCGFLALLNGFNLAPMPPLDGGWVVQSLLRPLGAQAWFFGSGLLALAGAVLAAYFQLWGLLVVAVVGAWGWSATRRPNPRTRPLAARGWILSLAIYVGLAAAHFALFVYANGISGGFGVLEGGPAFAQSDAF